MEDLNENGKKRKDLEYVWSGGWRLGDWAMAIGYGPSGQDGSGGVRGATISEDGTRIRRANRKREN